MHTIEDITHQSGVKQRLKNDGGVQSFNFEFTEWTHRKKKFVKNKQVLKIGFLQIQLMLLILLLFRRFYHKKYPHTYLKKLNGIIHHQYLVDLAKLKMVLFLVTMQIGNLLVDGLSELLTGKGKYILCPLEKLFFQPRGSLEKKEIKLKTKIDKDFKAGFYIQLKAIIDKNDSNILSLSRHYSIIKIYCKISGHKF